MDDPKGTYESAANVFAGLVARLPRGGWEAPALGAWDLRALVGHASRSLITVEAYLARPAGAEEISEPAGYFVATSIPRGSGGGSADTDAEAARRLAEQVEERGRQAGAALGGDPAARVRDLVDRVIPMVRSAGDPVIETIAGGMRLSNYLPTRTFEIVVHGFDIAAAAGVDDPAFPDAVLAETTALASRIAVARGRVRPVLMALTGRAPLPPGFSLL